MSYQVLARKWRPRGFAEMVGQEHVLRALSNALDSGRLHHAFLFTGTRGVGKTTLARILAKSVNCEQGISATPCGVCSTCKEIDEGRFVDLIEVDAASRTKVEDTRELLDNVQYAPTRGRYKVYLIDEVHMLSGHSFNALLKTLEEPPPHVKFLLATTDPQKLPVTILSRCLQFNLRRLSVEKIQNHLAAVLQSENIVCEPAALLLLAYAADGSMRDALSLLDQAIAYGAGEVKENDVRSMLGSIELHYIYDLLDALVLGDGKQLIDCVQQLVQQIDDIAGVLAELTTCLHNLALLQQVPDAYDQSMGDQQRLFAFLENLSPEDIQLYYQIALHGRRDLPLAPDPRNGLEMVLLRMLAFKPEGDIKAANVAVKRDVVNAAGNQPATAQPKTDYQENTVTEQKQVQEPVKQNISAPVTSRNTAPSRDWNTIVAALGVVGILRQVIDHCALVKFENNEMKLVLEPAHAPMLTKEREQQLAEKLKDYFSTDIKLHIDIAEVAIETPAAKATREEQEQQAAAVQSIETDANVQNIVNAFNANINKESVTPIEE